MIRASGVPYTPQRVGLISLIPREQYLGKYLKGGKMDSLFGGCKIKGIIWARELHLPLWVSLICDCGSDSIENMMHKIH